MLKGLYTGYSGMINEQHRMDTLTNNLANAATTGYKKDGSTSQSFDTLMALKIKDGSEFVNNVKKIGLANPGVKIGENYTNYEQGGFRQTGNTYDLALSGNGFFTIEFTNRAGEVSNKYTRDGSFTLNKEGYLVTKDGDYVLGENGRIKLDPLKESSINTEGDITQVGGTSAQLRITDFKDYDFLEHYGENYFQPVEGAELINADATVNTGYLEMSNVQVVSEMVEMISVTRAYESNQKIIKAYDSSLEIAVNRLGKL